MQIIGYGSKTQYMLTVDIAERLMRVPAETSMTGEDEPTFFGGDPDVFAARLGYAQRNVEEELQLIQAVRQHVARILRSLTASDYQRKGVHSQDGPISLATLLKRITAHTTHHVRFIEETQQALNGSSRRTARARN